MQLFPIKCSDICVPPAPKQPSQMTVHVVDCIKRSTLCYVVNAIAIFLAHFITSSATSLMHTHTHTKVRAFVQHCSDEQRFVEATANFDNIINDGTQRRHIVNDTKWHRHTTIPIVCVGKNVFWIRHFPIWLHEKSRCSSRAARPPACHFDSLRGKRISKRIKPKMVANFNRYHYKFRFFVVVACTVLRW